MATYGSRDRNPFRVPKTYDLNGKPVPSNNGNTGYYTLVDSGTGEITVKSPTAGGAVVGASGDRTVGTIPKDGVFKPELGSARTTEVQYFTSAQGQKDVKNHAVITAQKAGLNPQKSKQLIFPNTATPGGVPGTTPGTTPGATPAAPADGTAPVDLKIEGTGKKEGFGNHSYPLDLGKSKQDKIKFNMLRYAPRGFQSFSRGGENLGALTNRESTNKRILGSVILPVPSGISETNSCGWGEQTATPFELLAQNIALTSIQKGFGSGADVLGGAVSAAASPENSQELKTAVTGLIAQNAAGAGGLLSRTQGAVINPNLELLFTGPALRPFSFTFKMSARSETEAKEIIKIIRFFKQGMSPQKSSSNLFIKAPHTFEIRYILGSSKDKNHPFIGQIKECALQSFNVNYTPEGQYATFHDGPMISYEIQMQFTELEPVFNEDYGTGGSDLPTNLLFENLKKS